MAPKRPCRDIVRTIPGNATGGDDDVYVCADGSAWRRTTHLDTMTTGAGPTAYLHGGKVCDHK